MNTFSYLHAKGALHEPTTASAQLLLSLVSARLSKYTNLLGNVHEPSLKFVESEKRVLEHVESELHKYITNQSPDNNEL